MTQLPGRMSQLARVFAAPATRADNWSRLIGSHGPKRPLAGAKNGARRAESLCRPADIPPLPFVLDLGASMGRISQWNLRCPMRSRPGSGSALRSPCRAGPTTRHRCGLCRRPDRTTCRGRRGAEVCAIRHEALTPRLQQSHRTLGSQR